MVALCTDCLALLLCCLGLPLFSWLALQLSLCNVWLCQKVFEWLKVVMKVRSFFELALDLGSFWIVRVDGLK